MSWRRSDGAVPRLDTASTAHPPVRQTADPHGWGPIVAAANTERGFTDPARMPNGTHAPPRPTDPADTLNRSTYDAD